MQFQKRFPIHLIIGVLLLLIGVLLFLLFGSGPTVVRWTAIHVSGASQSGDAHLLETPDVDMI